MVTLLLRNDLACLLQQNDASELAAHKITQIPQISIKNQIRKGAAPIYVPTPQNLGKMTSETNLDHSKVFFGHRYLENRDFHVFLQAWCFWRG